VGIEGTSLPVGTPARTHEFPGPAVESPVSVDAADTGPSVDLGLAALFRHSSANAPPLRVGVLLGGPTAPRCFRAVLEDVANSNFARLTAVLHAPPPSAPMEDAESGWRGTWRRFSAHASQGDAASALYALVREPTGPIEDPLAQVPCADLLNGVTTVDLYGDDDGSQPRAPHADFAAATLQAVRALDLDVILQFDVEADTAALAPAARHGVWRYGELRPRRTLAGSLTSIGVTAATSALPDGLPLARADFPGSPTPNALTNRYAPYWGGQHLVIQKLNELHRHGWARLVSHARSREEAAVAIARLDQSAAFEPAPSANGHRSVLRRAARRLARADTLTDWFVGLRRGAARLTSDAPARAGALPDFSFLPNPPGRFLADPFLVQHDGRTWLFVEDYGFDDHRGVISCGELLDDGSVQGLRPCLERPHHLSYPSVFWHRGDAWMIPESEQNGTVDLYRAVDFPYRWTHERTLLPLRAVDPTPFRHDGRWWLYVTHTPVPGIGVTTLLYWADRLTGPWNLHPRNPVCEDVRAARGAGPVYLADGALYRPSQDCAGRYGRALVLNEVQRLTPAEYVERAVRRIEIDPALGYDGLHHYHRLGDWEVVDTRGQAPRRRFDQRPARTRGGSLGVVDLVPQPPRGRQSSQT
jgi:hypothetical protein